MLFGKIEEWDHLVLLPMEISNSKEQGAESQLVTKERSLGVAESAL